LLVGTSDGRFYATDPFADGVVTPFAAIDPAVTAMQRAAARGESFVPGMPDRLQLTVASLSPSGMAIVAGDTDGMVHVVAPLPHVHVSRYGMYSEQPQRAHAREPWIEEGEDTWELLLDGAATGVRGVTDAYATPPLVPVLTPRVPGALRGRGPSGGPSGGLRAGAASFAAAVSARMAPGAPAYAPAGLAALSAQSDASGTSAASAGAGASGNVDDDAGEYDAAALQGVGCDVPVEAFGAAALNPIVPHEPWSAAWTAPLDALLAAGGTDYFGDVLQHPSGDGDPRLPAWHRGAARSRPAGSGLVPARERASTLPQWMNDVALVPHRRRDVDPLLLKFADKTGTYINNNVEQLRLRANSLIYGRRKGYVDMDPRQRNPGASSLAVADDGTTLARHLRRLRSDSMSSGGSEDLDRMAGRPRRGSGLGRRQRRGRGRRQRPGIGGHSGEPCRRARRGCQCGRGGRARCSRRNSGSPGDGQTRQHPRPHPARISAAAHAHHALRFLRLRLLG
jgi:hypothetical protein